jgi:hypothetical protein
MDVAQQRNLVPWLYVCPVVYVCIYRCADYRHRFRQFVVIYPVELRRLTVGRSPCLRTKATAPSTHPRVRLVKTCFPLRIWGDCILLLFLQNGHLRRP